MDAVFQPSNYSLGLLSLPFLLGTGIVSMAVMYIALVRAALVLRVGLLTVSGGLLLMLLCYVLVASTHDDRAMLALYRLGLASTNLIGPGAVLYLSGMAGRASSDRILIVVCCVTSLVLAVLSGATGWACVDVHATGPGLMFYSSGWLAPVITGSTVGWVAFSLILARTRLQQEASAAKRRRLSSALVAFFFFLPMAADIPLGYGIGWYPLGWIFGALGLLWSLYSLLGEDLGKTQELQRRVPATVAFLMFGGLGIWLVRWFAPASAPLILVATGATLVFVCLTLASLVVRRPEPREEKLADSPLSRALDRYSVTVQSLRSEEGVGKATVDLLMLGLGCKTVDFLVPALQGNGWLRLAGDELDDCAAPDDFFLEWIAAQDSPMRRDDIEVIRMGDMSVLEELFDCHAIEVVVPLTNRGEVVGLVGVGTLSGERPATPEELRFLLRLQEHAAAALVYARIQRETTARVEVDKEVELAAAVQGAFVPGSQTTQCGRVTLSGCYTPASRCGGDWWSVHELGGGRVLVLIGDVTGHGIGAAMVTAAAKGCYDVAQRLMLDKIDLVHLLDLLDDTVRRAGGTHFNMTCFATLIDPEEGKVTFANAGHVVPYLCRDAGGGEVKLDALVARGNPLGAGQKLQYSSHTREAKRGDVYIWYTDGIVECANPERKQFGDRRMQRVLRKVGGLTDVRAIRDKVVETTSAFQEGVPADDDLTLVIGRIG